MKGLAIQANTPKWSLSMKYQSMSSVGDKVGEAFFRKKKSIGMVRKWILYNNVLTNVNLREGKKLNIKLCKVQ